MTIHQHHAGHEVRWPIRIGVIPEQAAHYQHRSISDQLDEALHGFGTVVLRQVLSGTGGVGKTQLAAHYARTLRDLTDPDERVDLLVWANASTRDQITFAYAQAAQQLFTTVPDDPEHAAQRFLTWLQSSHQRSERRWLVVWDDLADPATVQDLWPPHDQPRGRVLITTRRRDHSLTKQGHRLIDVDIYTPEEARAFLTDALNQAGIAHTPADLESLARDLGRLPLALGQAVTYMAELGMGCDAYLQVFHDRMHTLARVFPDWDTPTPLAATWELSLQQADTFQPQGLARPLLGLIALLDGTGIPQQVLTAPAVLEHLATHQPPGTRTENPSISSVSAPRTPRWGAGLKRMLSLGRTPSRHPSATPALSEDQARGALANLHRLNLITRTARPRKQEHTEPDSTLVGAHQLIQRATREHTTTRPTGDNVKALADALLQVWPEIERDTSLTQQLRSNTTVLGGHHAVQGRSSQDWLWEPDGHAVLFRAGRSLGKAGRVSEAEAYWQRMVETAHRCLGPDHSHTLITRNNLAHWRGETGDTESAAHAFEQLLTDRLRILGPDHPHTLITRHNLASWRGETGDTEGATAAYQELLTDQLRILGPDHPHTLTTRGNLAHWRSHAGDTESATHAFEQLLTDQLRILGPDHPHTLTTRGNLAHWRGETGDTEGATAAYQELLTDRLRVLGPDHPDTLVTRGNLAHWRGRTGDAKGATHAFEQLLTDRLRVLGPDHPDTLATRNNLASWRGHAGDAKGATAAYQELLTDRLRVLGPDHPDTLATRHNLAHWRGRTGDAKGAATALEQLLTDQLRILGPDHPHTLTTRHNLAHWRGHTGDAKGAATALEQLLTDQLRILGPDHPHTLT
ncbi:tetratricopeptide repeat protein, partial [Nocardiopsis alba]|uniref:tetratricopeptide repeat protein n=1 Tax=Nocardiopsis alba TaxID=53437 RepID=UPI0033D6E1DC